jgi:hypothetical protein
VSNFVEKKFRKWLVDMMGPSWSYQCHEDKYSKNIPDLSYGVSGRGIKDWDKKIFTNGWIELKVLPSTPAGDIHIHHFTAGQCLWLEKRGREGGNCYLLLLVEDHMYLVGWQHVRAIYDGVVDMNALGEMAKYHTVKKRFSAKAFKQALLT